MYNGYVFSYAGRPPAAAPSTGSKHQHGKEMESYLCSLFGPAPPKPKEDAKPVKTDEAKKEEKDTNK